MKRYFSGKIYLLALVVGCSIALNACTEEDSPDPRQDDNPEDSMNVDDNDGPDAVIDANAVSADLILENASTTNGSIPAASGLADLKLDKDTIFLIEGFKNRIRILYPPTSGFAAGSSSLYIQVEGADQYYDVKLDEEESSDTVGVFYMEFDTDNWEPPFSFKIKIAPHDESGIPIDTITTDVEVEKRGNLPCSPWITGEEWDWLYTIRDGEVETAPGFGRTTETHVTGCCFTDVQASVDCIANGFPESEWKKVTGISAYIIDYEILSFASNGNMVGTLQEFIQNLNPSPEKTNFCSGSLGYITHINDHAFWGEYTYDPSNGQIQFFDLESRAQEVDLEELGTYTVYDKYFINPDYLYEIISCHFLMETSSVEGQSRIRLFERRNSEGDIWHD